MSPELTRLTVKARLKAMAATGRPILVGDWRSELGFEALYWTAFLRWAKVYAGFKAANMVAVTRGGAGVLYPCESIDLYTLRSVQSVRQENLYDIQRTGVQKQLGITPWDRDVLKEAAALTLGRGEPFCTLHPSLMYRALSPYWDEIRGLDYLRSMTEFVALPMPREPIQLPDEFVAVKWYTRATFQGTDTVKAFADQVTRALAQQIPVVILTSGHDGDEHLDIIVEGSNIAVMPPVPPEKTVAVQATILRRAKAFVGTYGGMAQLALRYGIPSCSFYEQFGGTAFAHLSLSHWLSLRTGVPFLCGSLADTQLWKQVLKEPSGVPVAPVMAAPVPESPAPCADSELVPACV